MDPFHKNYRTLTPEEVALIQQIKDAAAVMYNLIPTSNPDVDGRAMSLAKTKLEESVMWVVKGITT